MGTIKEGGGGGRSEKEDGQMNELLIGREFTKVKAS